MKKAFKYYFASWAILFVVFNLVVILLPKEVTVGNVIYTKFAGLSAVTFGVFDLALILHLTVTYYALNRSSLTGTFYRIPLIRTSYAAAIITTFIGCIAMAVPNLPSAIPMFLVIAVLALYLIALLKAQTAATIVEDVDRKVKEKTEFMKLLTAEAEALQAVPQEAELKELCRKVFEAIRYSDPMSSDALAADEAQLSLRFADFSAAVKNADDVRAQEVAREFLILLDARNKKCKALK